MGITSVDDGYHSSRIPAWVEGGPAKIIAVGSHLLFYPPGKADLSYDFCNPAQCYESYVSLIYVNEINFD